uniref:Uncharacterized protein n=1 Tax=Myotis myotis TaxID=51298 RepID=A0A7J7SBW7_MYOMY|nr:hypothetical protein mMyoMyo1_009532 [Myotis myotis]
MATSSGQGEKLQWHTPSWRELTNITPAFFQARPRIGPFVFKVYNIDIDKVDTLIPALEVRKAGFREVNGFPEFLRCQGSAETPPRHPWGRDLCPPVPAPEGLVPEPERGRHWEPRLRTPGPTQTQRIRICALSR